MSLIIGKENTFDNEELIYEMGDELTSIAYILKGAVRVETETDEFQLNEGDFVAGHDLCDEFYSADYFALAGCTLMVFPAENLKAFTSFLENNVPIHAKYYIGVSRLMDDMLAHYNNLYKKVLEIYDLIDGYKKRYIHICEKSKIEYTDFMMPHDAHLYDFNEQSYSQNYQIFTTFYKFPEKLAAVYEKNGVNFLKLQISSLLSIYTTYDDLVFYLKTEISLLASNSQDCLFYLVSCLMEKAPSRFAKSVMKLLNDMKNILNDIDTSVKNDTGIILDIDYNRVNFYFLMASNSAKLENAPDDSDSETEDDSSESSDVPSAAIEENSAEAAPETVDEDEYVDFAGTLLTLCDYAGVPVDTAKNIKKLVDYYISMPDKDSREDNDRRFRKDIQLAFFDLYEKVFLKYAKDNSAPKLIKLFLDFGILDERLLTDDQLETLIAIPPLEKTQPCDVYRMSDWLMAIYTGKKMPSKNEFDQDYIEYVRERRKQEALTAEQEKALVNDMDCRIKFEIENIVKYNCRLLSGNLLSFVPMLNMESFENSMEQLTLTSLKINGALTEVLSIDYSAFYREQLYSAPEKKIERESIQLQVFPDIVLFPVLGTNSIMWQDLSGKRSNTSGRFFFPSFFRGDLTNAMITLVGRFRWELCKSIMGASWNNVSVASLTSEYCDYVQFYRKNHDLNSEKKEALKNQISKCRNNIREVFLMDYTQWIKNEFNGSIRLNKVARQMLATYCPFPAEDRARLEKTTIYADSMKRFNTQLQKKRHELNIRYKALERNGVELTPELIETLEFYNR